jgi:hypothetical protein
VHSRISSCFYLDHDGFSLPQNRGDGAARLECWRILDSPDTGCDASNSNSMASISELLSGLGKLEAFGHHDPVGHPLAARLAMGDSLLIVSTY